MYLDTRDLQKRLEELEECKEELNEAYRALEDAIYNADDDGDEDIKAAQHDVDNAERNFDSDDEKELAELIELSNEISEWKYGETLVPEDEFKDYVQELAEDIGAVGENADWLEIDWEATADNVKVDYTEVEYQGETYLVRA